MRSKGRVVGAEGGWLQALDLEVLEQKITRFADGDLGVGVRGLLALDQLSQRSLGFAAS
jgi:hypothetical protein